MEPMAPNDALAEAVLRCAMTGSEWLVLNPDRQAIWTIECDTKVDDDDLTFPVIVHMGTGVGGSDIAVLVEGAIT